MFILTRIGILQPMRINGIDEADIKCAIAQLIYAADIFCVEK